MPVSKLYVEGKTDERILKATLSLLPNNPTIERKGSKDDLPHIVRRERQSSPELSVVYLRDRDFDTEPVIPAPAQPDAILHKGAVHGYRWQRHEIESYLLTPALVEAAFGVSVQQTEAALTGAAGMLRNYTAARWTIGHTRRLCRQVGTLQTRPVGITDFQLPPDLSAAGMDTWITTTQQLFLGNYNSALDIVAMRQLFQQYQAKLDTQNPDEILLWYSPKDLLAAMSAWRALPSINAAAPADFCDKLARWLERGNGLRFFQLIPEAQALADLLTS